MTIRPPGIRLMCTTNRTSQLSQIPYRGAIALSVGMLRPFGRFRVRFGRERDL